MQVYQLGFGSPTYFLGRLFEGQLYGIQACSILVTELSTKNLSHMGQIINSSGSGLWLCPVLISFAMHVFYSISSVEL